MRYPLLDMNMNMRTAEVAKDHVVSYVLEPYENKPSSVLVKRGSPLHRYRSSYVFIKKTAADISTLPLLLSVYLSEKE